MGLKIALDNQISCDVALELEMYGHKILRAEHFETDKAFFKRAEAFGADFYVSPDYDWMNYALDRGLMFLHLGQGWNMGKTLREILKLCKRRDK